MFLALVVIRNRPITGTTKKYWQFCLHIQLYDITLSVLAIFASNYSYTSILSLNHTSIYGFPARDIDKTEFTHRQRLNVITSYGGN